jgi:hypothetical protein
MMPLPLFSGQMFHFMEITAMKREFHTRNEFSGDTINMAIRSTSRKEMGKVTAKPGCEPQVGKRWTGIERPVACQ